MVKNNLRTVFKALKNTALLIGFIVICLVAVVAFSSRFNLPGGYRAYSVLTGSMEPVIQTGSLIFTKAPKSTGEIKVNSVITFEEPGFENKFITHRVSNVLNNNPGVVFKTKGDANKAEDPWLIAYGRIKGVYFAHAPYLGSLLEFIKSPTGIIIFILIPVLLIVIDELRKIVSALADIKVEKDKKKNEKEEKIHVNSLIWLIVLPVICFGIGQTRALFLSNTVLLTQNSISTTTASSSPSPTQSPSGSPQPTNSPSAIPEPSSFPSSTPSPSPSGIIIEENGEGSTNTVSVENINNCNETQSNDSEVNVNIFSNSTTGGNSANGNAGGDSNTTFGNSSTAVNVGVTGGSNTSGGCSN